MINQLNSILIEGTVFTKPVLNNKGVSSFEVLNVRLYQAANGNKYKPITTA